MSRQAYRRGIAALTLAVLAWTTAAQARTLYVAEDGKAEFRSIGAAIGAARNGDTIVIEPGLYAGGYYISGKSLTLRSRDPNNAAAVARTIIDCREGGLTIGDVSGAADRIWVTLEGMTIRGSSNTALACHRAELSIINCTFRDNRVGYAGGAFRCHDSTVRLMGCTFSGNVSGAVRGGAIFCTNSELHLTACSFESNQGCAVVNYDSRLLLTDCTFWNNTGEDGGAMHNRMNSPAGIAVSASLTRCTFQGNSADASGGAIYSFHAGTTLNACTFISNAAKQDGGAIYNSNSNSRLMNCAFLGNTAEGIGGASSSWYGSTLSLVNCTFSKNRAAAGGAIAGRGQFYAFLSHSILWGNTAAQGKELSLAPNPWEYGGISSATIEYSNIAGGEAGVHAPANATLHWAAGNLDTDPLFRRAEDFSLSARSPCIDAGDPRHVPDPEMKDVVGNARRFGAAVDMGAYEAGSVPVFRFWSPLTERHFYTSVRGERDKIIQNLAHEWTYEGIVFYACSRPYENMVPLYRLWSARQSSHHWTLDEKEAQDMARSPGGLWAYEGIAFYVYLPFKQPWGALPVHRLRWTLRGGHFYTVNIEERDRLLRELPGKLTYEGIIWYALPWPEK